MSFSRSSGWLIAAARVDGEIGIDIEGIGSVGRHPVDDVLLHPSERELSERIEPDRRQRELARLWVAKEALVKSTGDGLRADLTQIRLELVGDAGAVIDWPAHPDLAATTRISLFELDARIVGALAVRKA